MRTRSHLNLALAIALSVTCGGGGGSGGPTSPPAPGQVVVGVIGCSQTSNAWRGWESLGDDRVWHLVAGYGGGDVAEWARTIPSGDYWSRLDTNIAENPQATAVWWQICDIHRDNGTFGDAEAVLAEIRRRLPGATVFASPLASFEQPETCQKQDIENSRRLTDHIVTTGGALAGPELPMVLDEWIQRGDGRCNAGQPGAEAFGATLSGFNWSAGG